MSLSTLVFERIYDGGIIFRGCNQMYTYFALSTVNFTLALGANLPKLIRPPVADSSTLGDFYRLVKVRLTRKDTH